MFYTLTANPAVDMTVSSSPLEPDENVRTGSASYTANGKGLDVSFAFKKMGVDTVALGFFAGFTGKFIVEEVMNLAACAARSGPTASRVSTPTSTMASTSTASSTLVLLLRRSTRRSSTTSWTPRAILSA